MIVRRYHLRAIDIIKLIELGGNTCYFKRKLVIQIHRSGALYPSLNKLTLKK